MKRCLCLLATFACLLSLTACGGVAETTLQGTWNFSFEIDAFGVEGVNQHLSLTLRDDGTFTYAPQEDRMRQEIAAHIDAMMTYAIASSDLDMTPAEYYAMQQTTEAAMIDEIVSMLSYYATSGTYECDGDKLYLLTENDEKTDDAYYTYALADGQLILSKSADFVPSFNIAPDEQFPLTLYR